MEAALLVQVEELQQRLRERMLAYADVPAGTGGGAAAATTRAYAGVC
jgi:hypothetical protein